MQALQHGEADGRIKRGKRKNSDQYSAEMTTAFIPAVREGDTVRSVFACYSGLAPDASGSRSGLSFKIF